ncbi:MAG: hypothetical protein ABNH38_01925 [Tateyamaria sp.]|jgi:uncharacterized membrane protein|uniref:hypothetical protein n=1 Tax=Tateyamaria sp. TaxID=1929288 RepID=UPI0032DE13A2
MKTTMLGGIIFLIPVAVISILLAKIFQLSMVVAEPIDQIIPISSVAGVAFVNFLAIIVILAVCYVAGLLAKTAFLSGKVGLVDGLLTDTIPGYAVAKAVLGSVSKKEDLAAMLLPVVVRFDDYEQIAFEIEREGTKVVIFLPGAPSAWSGSTVIVDAARVQKLDLPTHRTIKLMRVLGRGSLQVPNEVPSKSAEA